MTSANNYQSLDIFLNNSKAAASILKDEDSFDFNLDAESDSWYLDDQNDNFLESIRYGTSSSPDFIQDHLIMDENSDDNSTNSSSLEMGQINVDEETGGTPPYDVRECTPTATISDEYEEIEEEYALSPANSSHGSSSSGVAPYTTNDNRNHNVKVVQVLGILPAGCKTIQLIQQEDSSPTHSYLEQQQDAAMDSSSSTDSYPHPKNTTAPLKLSEEEKRLLVKEGISLPAHYPLTKYEERELKRIRRKIRNKISAQDSRKRKKEYLDKLQAKVTEIEEEKAGLVKRVRLLEAANGKLSAQVKRLQNALQNAARSAATGRLTTEQHGPNHVVPTATTLLVLILSLALVVLPSTMNGNNGGKGSSQAIGGSIGGPAANRFGFGMTTNGSIGGVRSRTMTSTNQQSLSSTPSLQQLQEWDDEEPQIKIPRFSFAQNQAMNNNNGGASGGKFIAASLDGLNEAYGVAKKQASTFQFIDDVE